MTQLYDVAGRGLALLIILLFFLAIYVKIRNQTLTEFYDEMKEWMSK